MCTEWVHMGSRLHGGIGRDGHFVPKRIADLLKVLDADVIAVALLGAGDATVATKECFACAEATAARHVAVRAVVALLFAFTRRDLLRQQTAVVLDVALKSTGTCRSVLAHDTCRRRAAR